jgi:signal transduction histidine kinase
VLREAAAVIRGLHETGLQARGRRIADSVRHIADMVHIQQNAAPTDAANFSFDLGQALRDVLLLHEVELQRGAIDVELLLDPRLPPLTLPRNSLMQCLMYIVGNACRAIQARADASRAGRLEIHAESLPDAKGVRIRFEDNGIGFDPARRASLFLPAADGLGLHATALFAQEMGGRVELQCPGLGQGARLVLELPLAPSGAKARIMRDVDATITTMRTGSQP